MRMSRSLTTQLMETKSRLPEPEPQPQPEPEPEPARGARASRLEMGSREWLTEQGEAEIADKVADEFGAETLNDVLILAHEREDVDLFVEDADRADLLWKALEAERQATA